MGDTAITPTQAAAVTVPTFGIVGDQDPNRAGLERLKTLRPSIKLVVVDGAEHSGERGILTRGELIANLRQFLAANRAPSTR